MKKRVILFLSVAFCVAAVAVLGVCGFGVAREGRIESLPATILWAWEQPQDLRFLDNGGIGVAIYAGTITLRDGFVDFEPRRQPAGFDRQTPVMPVIRIESNIGDNADYNNKADEIAGVIVGKCLEQEAIACQIDYDARESEIPLYKNIIVEVRKNLPITMPLSITALVSWCGQGSWLGDAEVDEAVPMFFRMGPAGDNLKKGTPADIIKEPKCRNSIGISTDESLPAAPFLKNRRIYIFSPVSWGREELSDIMDKTKLPR